MKKKKKKKKKNYHGDYIRFILRGSLRVKHKGVN
jgi:hypothetical protein